mmetsp:Transcript_814/g.1270  ORF Transcript_814/g.1270 Transcript_814/m.1270 type:complete len:234 (-) Transcript_814:33-734(-)
MLGWRTAARIASRALVDPQPRPPAPPHARARNSVPLRCDKYEPADARVEQKQRIDGECLPIRRHELAHEAERGSGGPEEADGDHEHPPGEGPTDEADECGDVEREYAVAEHADGLEEGDVAAEQQRVHRHDGCATPDDHEDGGEDEGLLLVGGEPGEQQREREAENERSPQIPVLQRLDVCLPRVEHAHHLASHHAHVAHDRVHDRLVQRALRARRVGAHPLNAHPAATADGC